MAQQDLSPTNTRHRQPRLETAADPWPGWDALRLAGPSAEVDGCPAFAQHDVVQQVLRDPATFSSSGPKELGAARPVIPLEIDPPEHRRYRKLLDPIFTLRRVREWEPRVRELAVNLIEAVVDAGACEFVSAVGELPSMFFLELLGLPAERLDELLAIKDGIVHPVGDTPQDRRVTQAAAGAKAYAVFTEAVEQARLTPGDDLVSRLLTTETDGEQLTFEEVLDICFVFLMAGLDTVAGALSCIFYFLAEHPELQRRLATEPSVTARAVEEFLRHSTVVDTVTRVATTDTVVAGRSIRAGTPCVVALGSTNIDPDLFQSPLEVDFDRNARAHLAFGGGIHRCLGSHLARAEIRIVVEEWHARISSYRRSDTEPAEWVGGAVRGLHRLPLKWQS